ncbi:MAG: hypothetical protein K6F90_08095 [Lachnospiraceae bacterium]|nr:hypothetical protein [Lachnospiraceae bacterium]
MAIGSNGELDCIVAGSSFKCNGIFIASDVEHTIYAKTGDLLLFLLDTTSSMAKCIDEKYPSDGNKVKINGQLCFYMVIRF